jgi:thioredoxin-like negative regulator of GroEL
MLGNLQAWEIQQEAKHAAMQKGGPLAFLSREVVAQRQEVEAHGLFDAPSADAAGRREQLISARIEALRHASFPDEIAYFRRALRLLNLLPGEEAAVRTVLLKKGIVVITV